ncbi:MAG TPA: cytochrome c [Rhizomicrobium sp.]|jgi:mono/diheme cytochrome c family protein|nr:cytochrome c [Rhizomicrobium sp.]
MRASRVVLALTVVLSATASLAFAAQTASHFADADNSALVAHGMQIYQRKCSGCHGIRLQGQPLWQLRDQFEGRRAPPHDATGHTWQHSDEDLFAMTKSGRFPQAPRDSKSYMPAYGAKLPDADIIAVLAFIKSRWPLGIRASQSMLNPGFKGMPKGADKLDWTLPPNCTGAFQRWEDAK